jgi:biotin carboxyl carrier protein
MKLNLDLEQGSRISEHTLEFGIPPGKTEIAGPIEFILDGKQCQADFVEVAPGVYSVLIDGRSYEARVADGGAVNSNRRVVTIGSRHFNIEVHDPRRRRTAGSMADHKGPQEILAPMPGKIVKVLAERGQEVAQGAGLLVIEAMKMQNELRAPRAGRIAEIYVEEGAGVESGARLLRLE